MVHHVECNIIALHRDSSVPICLASGYVSAWPYHMPRRVSVCMYCRYRGVAAICVATVPCTVPMAMGSEPHMLISSAVAYKKKQKDGKC